MVGADLVPGKRWGGPWWGRDRDRIIFERGTSDAVPTLARKLTPAGYVYRCTLHPPGYDARKVEILFPRHSSEIPVVHVDGPVDSKHRFDDDSLCIWYPSDPRDQRWAFSDGLLHLVTLTAIHLFKEAWWREHEEWLGPEVAHGETIPVSA